MSKLIMLSLVFMTIWLPMRHVGEANPKRAIRRTIVDFCWFNLFYLLALMYVVPRIM